MFDRESVAPEPFGGLGDEDRRLGDLIAKLQQLTVDPRCTPQRVFHAHAPDQFTKLAIDFWPPCPVPRSPSPEGPNTSAMPTKDCLRLNDMDRIKEARPQSNHPHQQCPVSAPQSHARRLLP